MIFQMLAPAIAAGAMAFSLPAPASSPAPARQDVSAAQAGPAVPEGPSAACCTVAAMTMVEIEFAETVSSKTSHIGDHFRIRLAEPLIVDGHIVAPAGTAGVGEVVHAAKARAMGKAGELILAARYLELNGQHIPLRTLRYGRSQGKDPSTAIGVGNMVAAAVMPIASVAAFFISGGEVNIPAGTRANAKVAAESHVPPADESNSRGKEQ